MSFELSEINDELVEILRNSEWFDELKQEFYSSTKKKDVQMK